MLTQNGGRTPISLTKENLKGPYRLNLKDGKYKVIVESQATGIVSKVQGIKNGKRRGAASADFKKTILEFGFGGNYSARRD